MDPNLLAVFIGIVAGAFGYWFTTFWMQPILRFKDLRNQVLMDFIYYAQVINADNLNERMKDLHQERRLANRKLSAQLNAALQDLPKWYLFYFKCRGLHPQEAAKHLIGYSNTTDYETSYKLEDNIRRNLALPKQT